MKTEKLLNINTVIARFRRSSAAGFRAIHEKHKGNSLILPDALQGNSNNNKVAQFEKDFLSFPGVFAPLREKILPFLFLLVSFSFLFYPFSLHAQEDLPLTVAVYLDLQEGTGAEGEKPFPSENKGALKVTLFFPQNFEKLAVNPAKIMIYPFGWTDKKQELRTGKNTITIPENLKGQPVKLVIVCDGRYAGMITYDGQNRAREMTVADWQPSAKPVTRPVPRQEKTPKLKEVTDPDEAEEYISEVPADEYEMTEYEVPVYEGGKKRVYYHIAFGFGNVSWPGFIHDEIDYVETNFGDLDNYPSMTLEFGVYWKLQMMDNSLLGFTIPAGLSDLKETDTDSESLYLSMDQGMPALSFMQFSGTKPAEGFFLRVDASPWGSISYNNEFVKDEYVYEHGFGLLVGGGYALSFGGSGRMTYELNYMAVITPEGSASGFYFAIGALF